MNTTSNNTIKLVVEFTQKNYNGAANPRLTGTSTNTYKRYIKLNMSLDEFCKKIAKPSQVDNVKYDILNNQLSIFKNYHNPNKLFSKKGIKMFNDGKITGVNNPIFFEENHINVFKSLYLYKEPTFTEVEL